MAPIISYLFRESRLIITTAFKRQSVKYANSNGANFGTCQKNNNRSIHILRYHQRDIRKHQDPFPKLLTQSSCSVVKLTDRKIRWIIREKSRDVLSTADIARLQNVSESRVRQLLSEYRKTGYIHVLNKPGRPLRNVSYFEISTGTISFYKVSLQCINTRKHSSEQTWY